MSVVYPQQSRYRCNVGYSLDGRAQDGFSNTFFASSCMATGTLSLVNDPCVSSDLGCASTSPSFQTRPWTATTDLLVSFHWGYELLPNHGALQMNWVGLNLFVVYGPSLQSVFCIPGQFYSPDHLEAVITASVPSTRAGAPCV